MIAADRTLPAALEAVVFKALEKDPICVNSPWPNYGMECRTRFELLAPSE